MAVAQWRPAPSAADGGWQGLCVWLLQVSELLLVLLVLPQHPVLLRHTLQVLQVVLRAGDPGLRH